MKAVSVFMRISSTLEIIHRQRKIWNRLLTFPLILIAVALILFVEYGVKRSSYWPGWFILKLPPATSESIALNALSMLDIADALGASNTAVGYMDIPTIKTSTVSELDKILIKDDPRRDPYLDSLSALFTSGDSKLLYLPANRSLHFYQAALRNSSELEGAELVDRHSSFFPVNALLLLAVLLLMILASRDGLPWIRLMAAAVPLAVFSIYLNPLRLFPLLLVYFLSPSLLWTNRKQRGIPLTLMGFFGLMLAAYPLYHGIDTLGALKLTLALVLSNTLFFLTHFFCTSQNKSNKKVQPTKIQATTRKSGNTQSVPIRVPLTAFRRRDHSLFKPISMWQAPLDIRKQQRFIPEVLLALLLILSFFIPLRSASMHAPFPSARKAHDGFDNLIALHNLANKRSDTSLPDVSQLLASVAYQEGFMYGAEFHLPLPDETLNLHHYIDNGYSISASSTSIVVYNEDWFETVIQRELTRGAGLLFASLGGPAPVTAVTQRSTTVIDRFALTHAGFSAIAFLSTLFLIFAPLITRRAGHRRYLSLFNFRRKAQAA